MLGRFHKKVQVGGGSVGSGQQALRTVCSALTEAVRRRHFAVDPATIAKAAASKGSLAEP
ncbi:hypothetical protein Scani_77130 [Streptomyces caniferus]|uniref:Uncharacterized protein n=1 Tax=Streptomyces caniferus TaxID=285557 RepID=A0A640SPR0_9ACTN|nr:hypothetical protein Scani_77130 [Streptomyces caniferus]